MYAVSAVYFVFATYISSCCAYIRRSGQEPVCPDITCHNRGTLNPLTCTCWCQDHYTGIFCDTEINISKWPSGNYSLISTVFGCPEDDTHGWQRGYVNTTLPESRPQQDWKVPHDPMDPRTTSDPHILGPYFLHSLQINFCTRLDDVTDDNQEENESTVWPSGNYCIFQAGEYCPLGFIGGSTTLGGYIVTSADTDGILPTVFINDTTAELTLYYCCREDGDKEESLYLPAQFPFILFKVNNASCEEVHNMIKTEERFDLVDDLGLFTFDGPVSILTQKDTYQRLGICYYEDTAVHECYHESDHGYSYAGTVNQSKYGEPCLNWLDVDPAEFAPSRQYVGDFKLNHCRLFDPRGQQVESPECVVNRTGELVREQCDIPVCDDDEELEIIGLNKPVYSVTPHADMVKENAVDGSPDGNTFWNTRPRQKPWIQVDLEEIFEVHAILVNRKFTFFPITFRSVAVHISNIQWDFFNYGALQCEKRRFPRQANVFRFVCTRPVIGQYVTIRNFDDPQHDGTYGTYFFLEVSEIQIFVKRKVCGRRLGLVSGGVRDFQLSGSSDLMTNRFDHGRLLLPGAGWCSDEPTNAYFKVDLIVPTVVHGLELHGWMVGQDQRFIEEFNIEYGIHEYMYVPYADYRGEAKVFKVDMSMPTEMIRRFMLHKALVTRFLRLNITKYTGLACLKMEIIGCPKQISRDIKCKETSLNYGHDVIVRGGFWMEHVPLIHNATGEEQCANHCENMTNCKGFLMDYPSDSRLTCSFYVSSRYNPHYVTWWITELRESIKTYMKLCIKEIKSQTECSGSLTEPGVLESPSYPFNYGQLLRCTWSIRFPSDKYIRIEVMDILMASPDTDLKLRETGIINVHPGKCSDTLNIGGLVITADNEATYRRAVILSEHSSMYITLDSCARYSKTDSRGFQFNVTYSDVPGCGSTSVECFSACTTRQAILTSPGYPSESLQPTSCRWRIQGNIGSFVYLTFDTIKIPGSDGVCSGAYVAVEDVSLFGVTTEVSRYCSVNVPVNPIKSSWQAIEIVFVSGEEHSSNAFRAHYEMKDYVQDAIVNDTEGCESWQRYGNYCYQIFRVDDGLTWFAADFRCQDYGGNLISLQSKNKVTFLHYMLTERWATLANGESDVYIGLQKTGTSGRFDDLQWSDGSPVTYTAWYKDVSSTRGSQPDGLDNERCTLLRLYSIHSTHNWHDVACAYNAIKMFVCERKVNEYNNEVVGLTVLPFSTIFANMSATLFECNSGEFIQNVYRCDGSSDCFDLSDELNCDEESQCAHDRFKCDNGVCIDVGLHCDSRSDCKDSSDETHCIYPSCKAGEWRCHSGQCIPDVHRCDVKHDCLDSSDELECRSCQNSTFQCFDQRCVSKSRVCDHFYDCSGILYEDEDATCVQNTRSTCLDWFTIGKRDNGSYPINLGVNARFEAECRFYKNSAGNQIVETIIHHQNEATTTWMYNFIDIVPKYAARMDQINILKNRSMCKQHVSVKCSYTTQKFWLTGDNGEELHNSYYTGECACPMIEKCDNPIGRCNCHTEVNPFWYGMDHREFLTDEGYITQQALLPIKSINSNPLGTSFGEVFRITLGPLSCQEEITDVSISELMVCVNNDLRPLSTRCVIDFDEFGEIIGCRDLSHLHMDCDKHDCDVGQVKCLTGGYCLPRRLLCDGMKHCPDGEDEVECGDDLDNKVSCVGSYHCRRSSVCIDYAQLCDGQVHCPLADDEMLCGTTCPSGCTCSLFGITCTNYDVLLDTNETYNLTQVRSLKISTEFLRLTLEAFYTFPLLTNLNVSSCNLENLYPLQFQFNENLIVLDVSFNRLESLLDKTFHGLQRMRVLLLKGNPLRIIEVNAFKDLDSLPDLDLSDSNIVRVNEKIFTGLEHIEKLNISNSQIRKVDDDMFGTLENIKVLDIRKNSITEFGKGIFNGLVRLQELYTSSFILCCVRPESVKAENCFSPKDEFSSCDDLMKNETLRAFLWIIGLSALLGNIAVLLLRFSVDRDGLGKTYGIFVTNLSIADFFMGIYLLFIAVADTVFRGEYVWNDFQWRNGVACKIAGIFSTVASEGSVIFLCFITIDRLLVVKFPFGNVRISRNFGIALCIIAWILIFIIALLPLQVHSYFNDSFYSRSAVCLPLPLTRDRPPGWEYSVAVFVVFNFLTFILIASGQIVIYFEVTSSREKVVSTGRRQDIGIARKLFFVAITDFMCWFPVGVMGMLALNGRVISGEVYAWIAVFVLPINSALNPFLYTLGNSTVVSKLPTTKSRRSSKRNDRYLKDTNTITEVFDSDLYEFGKSISKAKRNLSLKDVMSKRKFAVKEAFVIAWRLANGVYLLHSSEMVHGAVSPENVIVRQYDNVLTGVALKSSPRCGTEELEFTNDMFNFGTVIRSVLKA